MRQHSVLAPQLGEIRRCRGQSRVAVVDARRDKGIDQCLRRLTNDEPAEPTETFCSTVERNGVEKEINWDGNETFRGQLDGECNKIGRDR